MDQCAKIRLGVILTPGQVEHPPVKLTPNLIISPSVTPLLVLYRPEINTAAAQEYNILVIIDF